MKIPTLEGPHLHLVQLDFSFLADMHEYSKMPHFYRFMEIEPHKSIDQTRVYLTELLERIDRRNSIYWAIILNATRKMIGTFGVLDIDDQRKKAQIGYGISPRHWNRGFFKEALILVTQYCFEIIGLDKISAVTDRGNLASIKGLKRLGFKNDGCAFSHYAKTSNIASHSIALSLTQSGFSRRIA